MPLTIGGEGTRVTNEVRVEGNQEVVADRPLIDRDAPRDLPLPQAGEVVVPTRLEIDLIEKWGTGGKIDHAGILANGGYRAFNRDLREATEGSSKWEIAAQLDGVITDAARYYSLREQGTKLLALIGRT